MLTTIRGAGYFRRSSQIDYVSDYLLPTPDEFQKALEQHRYKKFSYIVMVLVFLLLWNSEIIGQILQYIPSKSLMD